MHLAINIVVVFFMLAMGWIIFFAWLIGAICRGVWRGVTRISGTSSRPRSAMPMNAPGQQRCRRVRCRAINPPQANFCRRCGTPLAFGAPPRSQGSSA